MVASLLNLAIGNSLLAVTLLLAMIRRGEASRVSALFFLIPPTAAVIAWRLIGETMPPLAWLGMALAAAGGRDREPAVFLCAKGVITRRIFMLFQP